MTEPLIVCRNLSKDYESGAGVVRALRNVDLVIQQGEFVAIVGTSGSGKSTLMNILGCLDRPSRGVYALAGFDVGVRSSDARAVLRNRLIGFIFQGFNLLSRTTALENVELPLVYRRVSTRERRDRALEALAAVGLSDRVHHTPNQLSGGQQQRVAIARALVTGPPMLLADEPTGNLDTRTSLEVLALLQRLNRERGITIILVTHEPDIAACASRVITFRDGCIVADVREPPLDAATALEGLASPDVGPGAAEATPLDPAAAERRRLGGPVPMAMYAVMAGASALGVGIGIAYCALLGGEPAVPHLWTRIVPLGFAAATEAAVASWFARRAMGGPLTSDQRARVAVGFTVGTAALLAPLFALEWLPGSRAFMALVADAGTVRVALTVLVIVLMLAAVALARFLLLSLLAPLASTGGSKRKASASS